MKIHYSGGLEIRKNGGLSIWLRGWPACTTGDAAYAIERNGNLTMNRSDVTCKKCLNKMKDAGTTPL